MFKAIKLYKTYKEVRAAIDYLFDVVGFQSIEWDNGRSRLLCTTEEGNQLDRMHFLTSPQSPTGAAIDTIELVVLTYFPEHNLRFSLYNKKL